ncbi:MAG: hypothetical protein IIB56_14510, partial [Planctomycetes bacterium]|nr:hypothetical protein [Planctomycetota bacterium]
MIRDDIQKLFADGVVERTRDSSFGDYTSNAAFIVSVKAKK